MKSTIDDNFYGKLAVLGHNQERVDWAINHLECKKNRMIYPIKLLPANLAKKILLHQEYTITEKGGFYLHMAEWDEYVDICGKCGDTFIRGCKSA